MMGNSSLLFIGVASLFWFLFRSGTKPTRVVYPCQRAAIDTVSMSATALLPIALTTPFMKLSSKSLYAFLSKTKATLKQYWKPILALLIIVPTAGIGISFLLSNFQPSIIGEDAVLTLTPQSASSSPASDIFVVNGQSLAHISNLIDLMGSYSLNFYQSSTFDTNQGPNGLIAVNDVVLLKINSQWNFRGGTNTDLLRELIEAILDHPDGFEGEIVIADNGQGFGSLDWDENNAEDTTQSVRDVVLSYSTLNDVSLYNWQNIRGNRVNEYSDGDMNDGYILNETADTNTGIYVSYPKFQTSTGTYISFKHGIWNGAFYENRLKVINLPILKSHRNYGVTGAAKHYMGVQSEGQANSGGIANGHHRIRYGGMGTLMAETRYPILNILDAIWINANPYPSLSCGPQTSYTAATRVNIIMASTDPISLDYWAAKNVLIPTAELNEYEDTHTLDPDDTQRGLLTEAFGVWLPLTEAELIQHGYTVTSDITRMNVYISQPSLSNLDVIDYHLFLAIAYEEIPKKTG